MKTTSKINNYDKIHYSEKKTPDSMDKLSKKMEYYDKLYNQFESKLGKTEKEPKSDSPYKVKSKKDNISSDETFTKIRNLEIKISDQKDFFHDKFNEIENQMKNILKRLDKLEITKKNDTYQNNDIKHDIFEKKIVDKINILEEKMSSLSIKFSEEQKIDKKLANFEKIKSSTKDNSNLVQEDVLNEINNIYSLLRKSMNSQREISLELQNLKKNINENTNNLIVNEKKDSFSFQENSINYEKEKKDIKYKIENNLDDQKYKIYNEMKNEKSFSKEKYNEKEDVDFVKKKMLSEQMEKQENDNYLFYTKTSDFLKNNENKDYNYNKTSDFYKNNDSLSKTNINKLEEYEKRNKTLKEKYFNGHDRSISYQNEYKDDFSIIKNKENDEKKKRIDDEINKRLDLENEKRDKLMGSIEIKRKINEKTQDLFQNDEEKFRFSPFSTEKSRNKEISSRLNLEKKLKEEKIIKLTDSIKK